MIILASVLIIGLVDLVWRWIPSFGLLGMGFDDAPVCRSLLEDVGYGNRTPPIDRYS